MNEYLRRIDERNYLTEREHRQFLERLSKDLDELEHYKNIEKELGCSIEVLFKAKKQQKIWTVDQWCSVEKIIVWDKSRKHKAYIDVKCDNGLHILASITDYKKSWWLKEDKSE